MLERAVIAAFGLSGKAAAWQFAVFEVVTEALAAHAFAGTRFIAACATLAISGLIAVHSKSPRNVITPGGCGGVVCQYTARVERCQLGAYLSERLMCDILATSSFLDASPDLPLMGSLIGFSHCPSALKGNVADFTRIEDEQ